MKRKKLAIFGGQKIRNTPFPYPPYSVIGKREKEAVLKALDEGSLSTFASSPSPWFLGSGFAKKLEEMICKYYGVQYAVTTNCCTAALHTALAAAGIGLGDEVIVTPWSFSSSAKAPLYVHAIPVFADIEDRTYGLDPADIERKITKYTKAIIVVHLFGHPARMKEIMEIARKHRLVVIEDAAQAHGAEYHGKKVGTIGDMGVFSFGASKQITAGEGGALVTNNKKFAERAQLFRNHGEVWGGVKKKIDLMGILGYGYLMDEMSAALMTVQMKSIDIFFRKREHNAMILKKKLSGLEFLKPPIVERHCSHAYYLYPLRFDEKKAGIPLRLFVQALQAEGIPVGAGYLEPLYWNPVYRWKVFYGKNHFPYQQHPRKIDYRQGDCPVVERLHLKEMMHTVWAHTKMGQKDINDVANAVHKISENIEELKQIQK